ncbi:hypothetical protein Afil01_54760 [Actinorhabdospora filicis]|uniref:Uncharacterized protein n=1 Tax=Actinorhabdospora filicis TaxID=1785913 RepID=A0A9W6SPM6_9ACTN|nr:7-cyano-7-deazaguanine synthase [Actinorhabdospora filicis]GLZ80669.1 hypothetical protein Afil01_54760 [Actinorhabdospora filicis]
MRLHFAGAPTSAPPGWTHVPLPVRGGVGVRRLTGALHGPPGQAAVDLFLIAAAVHAADKVEASAVSVPVVEAERWRRVLPLWVKLTRHLTGREWELELREASSYWSPEIPGWGRRADAVVMFGGGLDAFAHAVTLRDRPMVLVERRRRRVATPGAARLGVPVTRTAALTTRGTRGGDATWGLLAVAAGLLVCSSHRVRNLRVPENGLIAAHPPGGVPRPANPVTLALVNRMLRHTAMPHRVVNPWAYLTKGELARESGVELADTVSCAVPGDGEARHCGTCAPCAVRHAGLLAAGGDATRYRQTPSGEVLREWLDAPDPGEDELRDAPWPPGSDLAPVVDVVRRGRAELREVWG